MRESLRYPAEVRVWQEDESPSKLIASALTDRKINGGRIGIEERLPFTFYEHIREAAPGCTLVSADAVTIGCRAIKSDHELELMRLACEATIAVYREVFGSLKEGMTQDDIGKMISAGFGKMELRGDALVLIGASAALPHGSKMPQKLKDGDVVLIDGGCAVEGYESDVTRTGVFGKPTGQGATGLRDCTQGTGRGARRCARRKVERNGGRCSACGNHHGWLRAGLQIFYASLRTRDWTGWPRASLFSTRKQNSFGAGDDVFQ